MVNCTILLVDDDDVSVEAIQRSMRKANIPLPIVVAEDGQIALDILHGKHPVKKIVTPVITLLDINMPRMNGFEFLDAIRADEQLKPIIIFMLTTSGADSDRAKAYKRNIAGYMMKDAVGEQFRNLFNLLEQYYTTVALPAAVIK